MLGDQLIRRLALTRPADVERLGSDLPRLQAEWHRPWLDLGKSWRAMVLDGVTDAASRAVLGGSELGNDVAFAPARLVDVADVQARAAELAELLDRWPTDTMRAQVRSEFEALVAYYSDAAREGHAMLAWRH